MPGVPVLFPHEYAVLLVTESELQERLNKASMEGWELVTVLREERDGFPVFRLFLKSQPSPTDFLRGVGSSIGNMVDEMSKDPKFKSILDSHGTGFKPEKLDPDKKDDA
jgi:hypothetical protein